MKRELNIFNSSMFWQILMICVIPFIPLDLVKIVIASLVGMRFRKYIDKELDIN